MSLQGRPKGDATLGEAGAPSLSRIDSTVPPGSGDPGRLALDAAMLRAYTIARSLDYGASLDDVLKLNARVESGAHWVDVARQLAADDLVRARHADLHGWRSTASAFLGHAAAALRLAQAALEDDGTARLEVYQQQAEAFARAMRLASHDSQRLLVEHHGARHGAWLYPASPTASGEPPCVVVWGGADGWCEAFHPSVAAFRERGLAVCLVELPGQGLARLRDGSMLGLDFTDMVSHLLDTLEGQGYRRFGVAGHSLGGTLALAAAASDHRLLACCTNGGSVQLQIGLSRYPRVLERFGRMLGHRSPQQTAALRFIHDLDLESAARSLPAPLLCLHGGRDVLVEDAEVEHLGALHGRERTTIERWPDGVHCLYNSAVERNAVMADWFANHLLHSPTQLPPRNAST